MAITPADIEKKTFSTALRGYDLDEVDDFLDEMVVAVRELEEELGRARARIAELEQGSGVATPATTSPVETAVAPAAEIDESAVGRALVAAQQAADRILEEARREAEKTVGDARSEADNFAREREERRAAIEAEMADMTGLVAGVRTQLAVLATSVADKLDEMDAAVAGAQGTIAGTVEEQEGSEPERRDVEPEGIGPHSPDDAVGEGLEEATEPEGYVEDADGGLALDIDDMDASGEDDQAGSSEIEGVQVDEEDEEI
jgi:cell division initiation protein